jgi:membrane fusion protein, multidrug efflux system
MKHLILMLTAGLFAITAQAEELIQQSRIELGLAGSGIVSTVEVTTGQKVRKGQILLRLDQSFIKANQAAARSHLEQEKLELAEATREYERSQELFDRTQLSEHEMRLAEIAWSIAKAELAEASARLAQCNLQLEYSQLRAPVDGSVRQVKAWPGMAVSNQMQITPLVIMAPDPAPVQ